MAVITKKNFYGVPVADIPKADVYDGCNFTQDVPTGTVPPRGVRLFPGDDTPRVFQNCNMLNCEPPPGSTYINCLAVIKEFGVQATKADDVVEIDGVEVSRTVYTDEVIYARVVVEGGTVTYDESIAGIIGENYR